MRYSVAKDAEPQFKLLLIATLISLALWIVSWFIPLTAYLVYPIQLFATFIHEGSHVLATLLTGNSVQSLTVSPDTSGEVYSAGSGWFSQLLISSAGYVGTTAFGAALLAWMRLGYSSRTALLASSGIIAALTLFFGVLAPIFNLFATATVGGMAFTVFSGAVLAAALFAVARYAGQKWADLGLAFLAVQCLLNAIFSLVQLFVISAATNAQSDAANMAAATGLPAIVWVFIWFGISLFLISVGLRIYAVSNAKRSAAESVFED
jgi:hypothetical protein